MSGPPLPPDGSHGVDNPLRPATRSALDCPTCFTRCATRSGLMWHRMGHLQASNRAGERGRGRAAGRPPPMPPAGADKAATSGGPAAAMGGATDGDAGGQADFDGAAEVEASPAGSAVDAVEAAVAGGGAASSPSFANQADSDAAGSREGGSPSLAMSPAGAIRGDPLGPAAGSTGREPAHTLFGAAAAVDNTACPATAGGCNSETPTAAGVDSAGISVDAGHPAAPGSAARAALDPNQIDDGVMRHIEALLAVSRHAVAGADAVRGRKRRRLDGGGTSEGVEYTYTTVSTAVQALYEEEGDWKNSTPLVDRRKGWRPGRFDSFRLRAVQRFALESGGGGLSLEGIEKLWDLLDTWDRTKPGMPIDGGHDETIRDSFNSVSDFKNAVRDDVDDAALGAGWLKCPLLVDGQKFVVFFRPVLEVILDMLKRGKDVRLWSGETGPAPPSSIGESPIDGDAFRLNEAELMAEKNDDTCFVLGIHVYSDASQLSWSGGTLSRMQARGGAMRVELVAEEHLCAVNMVLQRMLAWSHSGNVEPNNVLRRYVTSDSHCGCLARHFIWSAHKLYPLRLRVVNVVTGETEWEPIAYIPLVRKQKEPSAEVRGRERRGAILQRVLYLAFRTTVVASHVGVLHVHDGKTLVAFPRLLLYMSDQPEEKAVLCLKGGSCQHPCSTCVVRVHEAGAPAALSAEERNAVLTVERQLEGAAHKRYQRERVRRTELEAIDSAHNRVPVVAGMAGMTTAPFLLYKSIGFDALHVCLLHSSLYMVACKPKPWNAGCWSWS